MAKTANELQATDYARMAGFDGDWRDGWWNQDYLELLARRTRLGSRRRLLDVGCGVGHWGQRLLPLAHPDATLVGVDREAGFLDAAGARAATRGLADRAEYRAGRGEALDFPDGHFDMATCQTVLMHATDAAAVLAEMRRVLAPGGLLLVAEPDKFVNALSPDRGAQPPTLDEALAMVELQAVCAAGKRALGHGDEDIGSRLHGLVVAAGFRDVRSWTNDRAAPLVPPYDDPWMALNVANALSAVDFEDAMVARSRRHWTAGGGAPARFEALWATRAAWEARVRAGLADKTYARGGAFLMVVVAGERC